MTSESSPAGMILAGDDGHLYRFPAEAMARWRQPAGAATTGTDDPTYSSPDGACYVIPRAEVEGYCLSEEQTAAIRSQLEQSVGADVKGYDSSFCPPGMVPIQVLLSGTPGGVGTYRIDCITPFGVSGISTPTSHWNPLSLLR
jgi:hypothetical protein